MLALRIKWHVKPISLLKGINILSAIHLGEMYIIRNSEKLGLQIIFLNGYEIACDPLQTKK